jgi:NAD+ diphosphatase
VRVGAPGKGRAAEDGAGTHKVAGVTLQSRTLQHLALSRATLDRAAHLRAEPELVQRLLADPATAVLLVDDDRAPVLPAPGPRLALVDPATAARLRQGIAGPDEGGLAAFLGTDATGKAHVLLATPGVPRPAQPAPSPAGDAARPPDPPSPDGAAWLDLRAVGHVLDDTDAGIMTCAVALANWHGAHPRCARCGTATRSIQAGWARSCPACGAEHYRAPTPP